VAQHPFCTRCGIHSFGVPRSDKIAVNARCLDGIDGSARVPTRLFDGRRREAAQSRRIADGGSVSAAGSHGAAALKSILNRGQG
jgi:hypothetical protein